MKTQTVVQNASLVSVVNGTIIVKDSTGREHTFDKASVVSVNNGTITIESEWKPKKGELVKVLGSNIDCYVIFKNISQFSLQTFGGKGLSGSYCKLADELWAHNNDLEFHPVTSKEQKEFDDFCKSQGKIWNKETLQWEKYEWKPKRGECYFTITTSLGHIETARYVWHDDLLDTNLYKTGNCFKTREEAKVKLEQIKKLLANG